MLNKLRATYLNIHHSERISKLSINEAIKMLWLLLRVNTNIFQCNSDPSSDPFFFYLRRMVLVFKNVLTLKNEIGTFENIVFNAKNVNMN